jgi:hypothetical protein
MFGVPLSLAFRLTTGRYVSARTVAGHHEPSTINVDFLASFRDPPGRCVSVLDFGWMVDFR